MKTCVLGALAAVVFVGVACSSTNGDGSSGETNASSGGSGSSGTSGTGGSNGTSGGADGGGIDDAPSGTMTLTSPAFTAGGSIPSDHSCDGAGQSIPIAWSGAPSGTKSYAVVMRDLTFTNNGNNYHWVIWDIPSSMTSLPKGIDKNAQPDPPGGGAQQTNWSFGPELGYGNMCPVSGPPTHEYELVVYAFATATLPVAGATGPNEMDEVIQANKTASGSIKGSYTKQ